MSRRKTGYRKPKRNFAIVADGETEMWYLQMLKRNEPTIRVDIKPRMSTRKKIDDQCELVRDLSENYTKVIWIVDMDAILEDSRQIAKGKETPLDKFKKYVKEFEADDMVVIIVNNPCLEFWFLLHFEKTSKYFNRCEEAKSKLKTHLYDYEKTQRYFTKQGNDIYLRLKDRLNHAQLNSMALGKFNYNNPEQAMCEMNLLFQHLGLAEKRST